MTAVPSLKGKVAVVTGATRGLGLGIAKALNARGASIAIIDRTGDRGASAALGLEGEAIGIRCDMASFDEVEQAWAIAIDRFGAVDIWINNAGLALTGSTLETMDPCDFRAMVQSNLIGTMHGCKVALGHMKPRGGAIYNMYGAGSDGVPVPGMIGYGTTKRAVQFFTEALAQEIEGSGVIVCGLSPGLVMTEGFLREHARLTPGPERDAREKYVNLIGDDVETVADWAADIIATNRRNGEAFHWLTPVKLEGRRQGPPRDILSKYLDRGPSLAGGRANDQAGNIPGPKRS